MTMASRDTLRSPIYVEHVTGYDDPGVYEAKRKRLEDVGFVRLEGVGAAGKRVEIFRHPGALFARGELAGTRDGDAIASWAMRSVQPGIVECAGQRWGLGPG